MNKFDLYNFTQLPLISDIKLYKCPRSFAIHKSAKDCFLDKIWANVRNFGFQMPILVLATSSHKNVRVGCFFQEEMFIRISGILEIHVREKFSAKMFVTR